jgi:hypothetical protein
MSWNKTLQIENDTAREAVLVGLLELRRAGFNTEAAIETIAPLYGISKRKIRSIVFKEPFILHADQLEGIKWGKIRTLRWLSEHYRRLADCWESAADIDAMEKHGQKQFRETMKWPRMHWTTQENAA